jgi:murein DD-endopeptidase MepM/ murein hydrolase activator NlpD
MLDSSRRALAALTLAAVGGIVVPVTSAAPVQAHAVAQPRAAIEPLGAPAFTVHVFPNAATEVSFSDTWGSRRRGGRRHRGTDIHSPKGTPVVAVASGRIIDMGWHRLSGWAVKIDHGGGWVTAYLHLNNDSPGTDDGEGGPEHAFATGLAPGSQVGAGQVIGYVGDSGNAEGTRAHTHFEIHHDGEKLNPFSYLDAAWRRQNRSAAVR